jgi:deoxyhypusine synthase
MNLCTKCYFRRFEEYYEIDLKDSWMYAAAEKIYQSVQDGKIVPWEIFFASYVIKGDLKSLR